MACQAISLFRLFFALILVRRPIFWRSIKEIPPMKKKSLRGFTLIELLVVLACLGIMMSFLYPAFIGMTQRALGAKDMNNMRQIGMALQTYLNDKEQRSSTNKRSAGDGDRRNCRSFTPFTSLPEKFSNRLLTSEPLPKTDDAPVSYGINQNTYDLINANMLSVRSPSSTILMAPNYNGDPALRTSWTGTAAAAPCVPIWRWEEAQA